MRDYLKKLRKDGGMTQQVVADMLGIRQSYYGDIERGIKKQRMDIVTANKLAKVFGVPLDYIIKEENKLAQAE